MQIRYLGHSCFEFTTKNGTKIITDPYTKVGYELPNGLFADVLTISHAHFDHNYFQGIKTNAIISQTGEYTLNDVKILGIECDHDPKKGKLRGKNIIFRIIVDDLILCHMGDVGEECSPQLIEKIGEVDLLFIPVGGTYTIDALGAKKYIEQINPKTVIPMHYKPLDGALDIASITSFLDIYKDKPTKMVLDGVTEINTPTNEIIYMERVNK